ncbi:MAG: YHS domain-containing protein [Ignavibacteria bacterium]|nr:YHS domain-containing protein [Ignavibacteria bacterium]
MKVLTFIVILFIAFGGATIAQKTEKTKITKSAKRAKTEVVKEAKMICPVTGEEADPEVSLIHKGTKYYFCCMGCVGKFKKDPAKFIKASEKNSFDPCEDEGEKKHEGEMKHEPATMEAPKVPAMQIRFMATQDEEKGVINEGKDLSKDIVNAKCPIMDKKVNKSLTTVTYKGKVYGFCCKSCIKKFAKNPARYLKTETAPTADPKLVPGKL